MAGTSNESTTASDRGQLSAGGPLWRKAPFLLLRYPSLFAAIAAAALVLGLITAAAPLYLSSAGTGALVEQFRSVTPSTAGLTVAQYGRVDGATIAASLDLRTEALDTATGAVESLGSATRSLIGTTVTIGDPNSGVEGRVAARTGAADHLDFLEGPEGDGFFVSRVQAVTLNLDLGEHVTLTTGQSPPVEIRVAGIYEDLSALPITAFWQPIGGAIYGAGDQVPPPLILGSIDAASELDETLGDRRPLQRWEYPLAIDLSLEQAEILATELRALEARLDDGSGALARILPFSEHFTVLPDLVNSANDTVTGVRSPVSMMGLGGRLVALVVIAAAGVYGIRRRRIEAAVLGARGMGPAAMGVKSAIEAIGPIAIGVITGWGLASVAVRFFGPSGSLPSTAYVDALGSTVISGVIAVVVVGIVAAVAARREADGAFTRMAPLGQVPWELGVMVLAGLSFYQLDAKGLVSADGNAPPKIDLFMLMFPILFIAAGAGLATKGLSMALPRLKELGREAGAPLYLATRRLASAPRLALMLVTASSLAIGVLAYAGILVGSVEATADAKARVSVGSDFAAQVNQGASLPTELSTPATIVTQYDLVQAAGTDQAVTILAVDPMKFAEVAYWSHDFSGRSLAQLMSLISDGDGDLPVIVVGDENSQVANGLDLYSASVPVEIVDQPSGFPGMNVRQPTVVADAGLLEQAFEDNQGSIGSAQRTDLLWARGDADEISATLRASSIPFGLERSAERAKNTPTLLAVSWTFQFLQALGIITGFVVLAGMLLYLQSRQRAGIVSFALARRMGLKASAYRSSVAIELAALLGSSLLIGTALAFISGRIIYGRFDLLPELPPAPLWRVPVLVIVATGVALGLAALFGAWRVQRTAQSATVSEVLRLAE